MKIIWSEKAVSDYWQNIDFLIERWGDSEALSFISEVEQVIFIISKNPKAFPKTNYKKVHQALVVPQITLFYLVSSNTIELVRFWNNHQHPKKLEI